MYFENLRNRKGKAVFSELQRLKTAFVSSFMGCYLAICVKLHAHLHQLTGSSASFQRAFCLILDADMMQIATLFAMILRCILPCFS